MEVLWWLAPPLAATVLAMVWASWRGRARDDVQRESTDESLARLGSALARPLPRRAAKASPARRPDDPTHGVAVRRTPRAAAESTAADDIIDGMSRKTATLSFASVAAGHAAGHRILRTDALRGDVARA